MEMRSAHRHASTTPPGEGAGVELAGEGASFMGAVGPRVDKTFARASSLSGNRRAVSDFVQLLVRATFFVAGRDQKKRATGG